MCCWYNLSTDKLKIEIMTERMAMGVSGKSECIGFTLAALQVPLCHCPPQLDGGEEIE